MSTFWIQFIKTTDPYWGKLRVKQPAGGNTMNKTALDGKIKRVILLLQITKVILVSYISIRIIVSFVIPVAVGFQYISSWGPMWMNLFQEIALWILAWTGPSYAIVLLRLLSELPAKNNGSNPQQ